MSRATCYFVSMFSHILANLPWRISAFEFPAGYRNCARVGSGEGAAATEKEGSRSASSEEKENSGGAPEKSRRLDIKRRATGACFHLGHGKN